MLGTNHNVLTLLWDIGLQKSIIEFGLKVFVKTTLDSQTYGRNNKLFKSYIFSQKKLKQSDADTHFYPTLQLSEILISKSEYTKFISGEYYDEKLEMKKMLENDYLIGIGHFYAIKSFLMFFMSEFDDIIKSLEDSFVVKSIAFTTSVIQE